MKTNWKPFQVSLASHVLPSWSSTRSVVALCSLPSILFCTPRFSSAPKRGWRWFRRLKSLSPHERGCGKTPKNSCSILTVTTSCGVSSTTGIWCKAHWRIAIRLIYLFHTSVQSATLRPKTQSPQWQIAPCAPNHPWWPRKHQRQRKGPFRSMLNSNFLNPTVKQNDPWTRSTVTSIISNNLSETCFRVQDCSTCLQGDLNMNLFGCRQTLWLKGCWKKMRKCGSGLMST